MMATRDFETLAIFQGLSAAQIEHVTAFMTRQRFESGKQIFRQDETASALYLLLKGEVEVSYKPYDGPPLTVARIAPGGVFGWSAAMGRAAYTSGAIALMETEALRMGSRAFQQLNQVDPGATRLFLDRLAGQIAERLHSAHVPVLDILSQGVSVNTPRSKRREEHDTVRGF